MWIARDKDGSLYFYTEKPKRDHDAWVPKPNCWIRLKNNDPVGLGLTWEGGLIKVEFKRKGGD